MRDRREEGQGATPDARPRRRLLGGRKPLVRSDSERIAAVAAEAHVPVEQVLRDVADFRLALETDMIIAAAAVEAESPDLLSEVIDGERLELATFHDRLLERLADAAAEDEIAVRRDRKVPRAVGAVRAPWLVAASVALVALLGAGRAIVSSPADRPTDSVAMQTADQRFSDFSSAVSSSSPVAVRKAANDLHATLETLITQHANDPAVAQRAAQILQAEISLLRVTDPEGASQVLDQARKLVTLLQRRAPEKVRASVKPVLDAAVAPPKATTKPKSSPSPSASPKPKTSPSPSPSASPSSGTGNPLNTP